MRYLLLCLLLLAGAALNVSAASSYYLNPNDPNAVAACTAQGGVVQMDASRRRVCVIQQAACAPANMPYLVNPNDPYAAQTCAAACGTIQLNASGQRVCVANTAMREPPNQR